MAKQGRTAKKLDFDPIDEAARQWGLRWGAVEQMHAVTSLMRVQQLVIGRLDGDRDLVRTLFGCIALLFCLRVLFVEYGFSWAVPLLWRMDKAWRGVRFSFVTRNPKRRPTWMAIGLEEGPFRRFDGQWTLAPVADWGCRVDFHLAYEMNSTLLGSLAGVVRVEGRPAPILDAEIVNEASGNPQFEIRGSVLARAGDLGVKSVHVSLSHDAGIASAMVFVRNANGSHVAVGSSDLNSVRTYDLETLAPGASVVVPGNAQVRAMAWGANAMDAPLMLVTANDVHFLKSDSMTPVRGVKVMSEQWQREAADPGEFLESLRYDID